jgi:hypothetical protein
MGLQRVTATFPISDISQPEGCDVPVSLEPQMLDHAKHFIAKIERRRDVRLDTLRRFVED